MDNMENKKQNNDFIKDFMGFMDAVTNTKGGLFVCIEEPTDNKKVIEGLTAELHKSITELAYMEVKRKMGDASLYDVLECVSDVAKLKSRILKAVSYEE